MCCNSSKIFQTNTQLVQHLGSKVHRKAVQQQQVEAKLKKAVEDEISPVAKASALARKKELIELREKEFQEDAINRQHREEATNSILISVLRCIFTYYILLI